MALQMENGARRATYLSLCAQALAFGWIEASVVVYLREISAQGTTLQFPLVSLPSRLVKEAV
jgi:hypothetical protein